MQLQHLSTDLIRLIYKTHMKKDFPSDELKPLDHMLALIDADIYTGYGLFKDETLLAYAFLTHTQDEKWLLLDYLAVCSPYRNQGYGSQFLKLLRSHCKDFKGIFIEIESIASAKDSHEHLIRTKRLAFYLKNGAVQTPCITNCFGVEFSILVLSTALPITQDLPLTIYLDRIYKAIFPPHLYATQIRHIF